ncbi:thioredoxin domain-containing protein [Olivibacter sp. XZL3]|uniref:thioredoxin domain-containing protein n=1 Tax=Olivibacter sp. XZL3 TaxID=1735116 RepID=UPI001065ADFF|nr:thioredoxin domain-containing protein [Olivibacter sp. XZL3]
MKKNMYVIALLFTFGAAIGQEEKQSLLSFADFEQKFAVAGSNAQILDARSEEEYRQNHVKGAVNVANEKQFTALSQQLAKNKPVFVYSIGNGRSGVLAAKLHRQGFKEVYEFPGGLSKWIGQGKPVESTVGEGLSLVDFNQQIKADQLVLVDVGSRYCGGCKKLKPIVEEVVAAQSEVLKLVDIEAYENKSLVRELAVEGLPTLLLYKDEELVWKKQGQSSKEEILEQVNKFKL